MMAPRFQAGNQWNGMKKTSNIEGFLSSPDSGAGVLAAASATAVSPGTSPARSP
jgi:hypothetical protein